MLINFPLDQADFNKSYIRTHIATKTQILLIVNALTIL